VKYQRIRVVKCTNLVWTDLDMRVPRTWSEGAAPDREHMLHLIMTRTCTLWCIGPAKQAAIINLQRYRPWYRQKRATSQLDITWTCRSLYRGQNSCLERVMHFKVLTQQNVSASKQRTPHNASLSASRPTVHSPGPDGASALPTRCCAPRPSAWAATQSLSWPPAV